MRRGSIQRYPMEAKGVGVVQHHRKKTYMFLVLWSDRNNILIYRTYEEFKKFHVSLKKKFPIEAGHMKKSERTIPKFKDASTFTVRKEPRRFLARLRLLETYVQELLRTDAKISQGEDVTAFFTPHLKDLDPAFHENSIVIMPSEARDGKREISRQPASDAVIQPIRAEQYCCLETYEAADTKNRPFKVRRGELVDVLLKDTTGWWLVENEEKCLAWFPAPYLSKLSTSKETSTRRQSTDTGELYFAVKCYEAKDSDELSMNIGVVVEVLEKSDDGWWLVWYNEHVGYVPSMFLRPYNNPHQKFQAITKNALYASTPDIQETAITAHPRRVSLEEVPSQNSNSEDGTGEMGKSLQRKQSRSLSSLPITSSKKVRPPLTLELDDVLPEQTGNGVQWKPTPSPRNIILSPENTEPFCMNSNVVEGHGQWIRKPMPRRHLSKDAGLGDSFSTSGSDDSLSSSSDSRPKVPKVPQKPEPHEIMERCTTFTKKALQRSAPILNSMTISVKPESF
ncbi:NADPH oxidase organizer 1-like isoform X1 [Pleurodeles waltl]|uniref:NADPH oxidase organizer 1-like isoform X1 n=2 Tax=Pleurodeles waltl TaxID=8319 RepID=UPI003709B0A8